MVLNKLHGSYSDDESKIYPVKIHIAKQPYDPVNKILIQPKLFAEKKGEGALWQDFDWQRAAEVGMKESNLPFSGKVDFIETEMYWPVNHMVSKKEDAVSCNECHTRSKEGRLNKLNGFYLPGRDYVAAIDTTAYTFIILAFIGIVIHSSIRIISKRKNKGDNKNV